MQLSLIPEEYLSPMPTGATIAMLRRLGRIAGIEFTEDALAHVARETGNMPYWSRKCCSYVHRQIPVGERPLKVDRNWIEPHVSRFIQDEGSSMAAVALSHLFRVHPGIYEAAQMVSDNRASELSDASLRTLRKYGLVGSGFDFAGSMISSAFSDVSEQRRVQAVPEQNEGQRFGYDDWAEELAALGKRRNILERRLRSILLNFIRSDLLTSGKIDELHKNLTSTMMPERREKLQRDGADKIVESLYWSELSALALKNWRLLERIFSDKAEFKRKCDIVNDRPDAHAKDRDLADFALYRQALEWLEIRISKLQ